MAYTNFKEAGFVLVYACKPVLLVLLRGFGPKLCKLRILVVDV
jgi:hypothetical protein